MRKVQTVQIPCLALLPQQAEEQAETTQSPEVPAALVVVADQMAAPELQTVEPEILQAPLHRKATMVETVFLAVELVIAVAVAVRLRLAQLEQQEVQEKVVMAPLRPFPALP